MPQIHPILPADGDDAIVEPYNAALNLILGVLNGSIDADNLATGAVTLSALSTTLQTFLVPTAATLPFAGATAPTGYLMCDGSSVLRASYSALFAAIGTSYGSADGTHFNLPDMRGRVPVGNEIMGGSSSNRAERTATITTTSGSPTATVPSTSNMSIGMYIKSTNVTAGTTILSIDSATQITMSANATGAGTTIAARFSMLTDAEVNGGNGGVDIHKIVTAQLASHAHGYSWGSMGSTAGTGGMYATIRDTTVNTTATGGDQAHPNMQPSLVFNYIIKT